MGNTLSPATQPVPGAAALATDLTNANASVNALLGAVSAAGGSLANLPQYLAPPPSTETAAATAAAQAASIAALQQNAALDTSLFMAQYGRLAANSGANVSPLSGGYSGGMRMGPGSSPLGRG